MRYTFLYISLLLPFVLWCQLDYEQMYSDSEEARALAIDLFVNCKKEANQLQKKVDRLERIIIRKGYFNELLLDQPTGPVVNATPNVIDTPGNPAEGQTVGVDAGAVESEGGASEGVVNYPPEKDCPPCDFSNLEARITILETQLATANTAYKKLEQKAAAEKKALRLKLVSRFDSLMFAFEEISEELTTAQNYLMCIEEASNRAQRLRAEAQPALDSARARYELYLTDKRLDRKRIEVSDRVNDHIEFIFDIYSRYDDRPDTIECGPYVLRDVIQFTSAADHIKLSNILVGNPGRLINNPRFGGNTDQRVMNLTAEIIYNVSKIYSRQTNYNERSQGNRVISRDLKSLFTLLPGALQTSRGNVDMSDSAAINREYTKASYDSIPILFASGRYVTALSKYDLLSRFEADEDLKIDSLARAEAHLAIGTILLFDLGGVSQLHGVTLPGTWLYKTLPELQDVGARMLSGVVNMNAILEEELEEQEEKLGKKMKNRKAILQESKSIQKLQKEAAYRLSKRYRPLTRQSRRSQ